MHVYSEFTDNYHLARYYDTQYCLEEMVNANRTSFFFPLVQLATANERD